MLGGMAVSEPTVGDVMLRDPKTLPVDVTVAEAREALARQSVQMLLLVDGVRFHGAVTTIPDAAEPDEPAVGFVDGSSPIVTQDTSVSEALELLPERASGRIVVVDGVELVGLVCLAKDGVRFCGSPDVNQPG